MRARQLPVFLFLGAVALPAHGWQGHCRPAPGPDRLAGLDESLCRPEPTDEDDVDPQACQGGFAYARGVQLGEHTWLTRDAMRRAGFPASFEEPFALDYWILDHTHVPGTGLESLQPAALGGMRIPIHRPVTIAELSEIPDGSHSFSDYLMGNEHCLVPDLQRSTTEDLERCHSFRGHMGTLNATHWMPLSRAQYDRYHAFALATAGRCAAMQAGIDAEDAIHPLADQMTTRVAKCEREALAFEAIAAHYLQDAWASGHMFERWGSPFAGQSDEEKMRSFFAAAMTGFLHGTRAVLGYPDRANMPGRFDPDDEEEPMVRAVDNPDAPPWPAGGDLYLAACTSASPEWAVATGSALSYQRERMATCIARGFAQVYRAGPQTAGALGPEEGLDDGITSSTEDACWSPRLTNESMLLSLGSQVKALIDVDAPDLTSPSFFTRFLIGKVVADVDSQGVALLDLELTEAQRESLSEELRRAAGQAAVAMAQTISHGYGGGRLEGTGIATQENHALQSFAGVASSGTFERELRGDAVPYLEGSSSDLWSDEPVLGPGPCRSDADCMDPRTYCDRTTVGPDQNGQTVISAQCVPHEGAVVRAFRDAETPRFCDDDDGLRLYHARSPCAELGVGCDACVEVLTPHIRNGCGPDWYEEQADGIDHRSMCDVFGASVWPVWAPYAPADPQSLARVALAMCRGEYGYSDLTTRPIASLDVTVEPPGPEAAQDPHASFLTHSSYSCATAPGREWFRFRHQAQPEEHVHTYAVRIQPTGINLRSQLADLEVGLVAGPDCRPDDLIGAEASLDHDGDGTEDTLFITETIPANTAQESCLYVRTSGPEVYWTDWTLATDPFWLDL